MPDKESTTPAGRLYRRSARYAKVIKAVLQMTIGIGATLWLLRSIFYSFFHFSCVPPPKDLPGPSPFCYPLPQAKDVLELIGAALAASAVVELSYTLFTPGPDEALDPLMLGITAAALIQLGNTTRITSGDALALILEVLALGGLFAVRLFLAGDLHDPEENTMPWWVQRAGRLFRPP